MTVQLLQSQSFSHYWSYVMEASGKRFLYSLAYHVEAHLAGFRSEANSVLPQCSWGNQPQCSESLYSMNFISQNIHEIFFL